MGRLPKPIVFHDLTPRRDREIARKYGQNAARQFVIRDLTPMTDATPVTEPERYQALDLLRGCAVLGILVMNIQSFAMPFAAYFNPTALGDRGTTDFAIWTMAHFLFDQKFMTIFSLLFGAGVLLMTTKAAQRGAPPAALHYRRMVWLLLFGLIHAYLIWYGDILVLYAVCGLFVYLFRKRSPRALLIVGLIVVSIASLISVAAGLSSGTWPPEAVQDIRDFWSPDARILADELTAFQGGWLTQMPKRAEFALEFHAFEMWIWGIWRAGGLMLIGMALLKWRVLTGERAPAFYTKLAIVGFGLGVPLIAWGFSRNIAEEWEATYSFFIGAQWNYWGSILVSLGWIGLFLRVWLSGAVQGLVARLTAVGRTAFSCYILESLICTTIFYGHGFGLFGSVGRAGQVAITFAIWIVLLLIAPLWLQRFRFGPLEWLWRTLTYGRQVSGVRYQVSGGAD